MRAALRCVCCVACAALRGVAVYMLCISSVVRDEVPVVDSHLVLHDDVQLTLHINRPLTL